MPVEKGKDMKKKYKVATAFTPDSLSYLIESYISEGWELVGGVSRDSQGMYHQALVK